MYIFDRGCAVPVAPQSEVSFLTYGS